MVDNGTAFYVASPSLTPGQQVIHPPANLLDRDFRSFIREANVSTVPTIPSAVPAVNLNKPLPLTPSIATISNPPSGGQARSYRVQNPGGESILDIAERVLGNRSQWTEIYRINQTNPAVRPPALIPANTELKMPG
jgi:nucleoid-associated protein YgaU